MGKTWGKYSAQSQSVSDYRQNGDILSYNSSLKPSPALLLTLFHHQRPSRPSFTYNLRYFVKLNRLFPRSFRSFSRIMATNGVNGHVNGIKPAVRFELASRLQEGRALVQDVWSIFKYVGLSSAYNNGIMTQTLGPTVLPICHPIVSTWAKVT